MTSSTRQRTCILLIDPGKVLPTELRSAFATSSQWIVVGERTRRPPTVALVAVAATEQPYRIINTLFTTVAAIPVVVYDLAPSTTRQAHAFNAGAKGYSVPGVTIRELKPMLELAQLGGFSICPGTLQMMADQLNAPMQFSRREQEVVALAILGTPQQEIADELHIALPAVEDYLLRAFRKVGVDSLPALATWWTRWLMLDRTSSLEVDEDFQPTYVLSA